MTVTFTELHLDGGVNTVGPCGYGLAGVGCGTVYKVTPEGAFTSIYSFCSQANCADGSSPDSPLLAADDGELYGMTSAGGANGYGTIFKITPSGKLTTLYSFPSYSCEAQYSCGVLVQATDGNFYGVTSAPDLTGAAFKLTPGGTFSTLYNFCSQANCADGSYPESLVQGTDGRFYGATIAGGTGTSSVCTSSCGTVFSVTGSGELKTLHNFSGTEGYHPTGMIQSTNGSFYGIANFGGANGDGTVFSLSVGLGRFVELLPSFGKVGGTVQILGDNLSSTTAVTFNSTAAAFTVESATLISASVPAGATTGFVKVTTSSGALKSNVKFHVK